MGVKIESQLEVHLVRQANALTQICCILHKKQLKKKQRNTTNIKKLIPRFMPQNLHDKVKTNHNLKS